nr:MAG TPA: hypothetical protein [Caudoviricetes sp.]DAX69846.1 MAG TPA: hypothetical protein [Caudoviricetes sp.]
MIGCYLFFDVCKHKKPRLRLVEAHSFWSK